jgi:hypothetical protein
MIWYGRRQFHTLGGAAWGGRSAYGHVPAGVYDGNAQGASIVLLCISGTF